MATPSGAQAGSQELSNPTVHGPPTSDSSNNLALTTYNPAAALTNVAAPSQASRYDPSVEADGAWPLVTKHLIAAVVASHQPANAATTLLTIFKPIVDGWAASRKEAKRWKERTEAHMAELHRQKSELGQKHESLLSQQQVLELKLAESQGLHKSKTEEAQDLSRSLETKQREWEDHRKAFHSTVTELQKKFVKAEEDAAAAKEAHRKEAEEKKREAEASAKRAQEAKLMHEKFRQEAEEKEKAQAKEITNLGQKIAESETNKAKLEEQLRASISKNRSLEAQLVQKAQDYSSLENRVNTLTSQKEALERQIALYQRYPTRRY